MEEFLREIEHLIISTKKRLITGAVGNRKGKGLGSSHDFYGHRIYIPGDDIRRIDWKAYVRTEKFYVREFTEEREMKVNIILDSSASMDFGIPNKLNTAKMITLGIAYITLNQLDSLSIYTINEKIEILREDIKGKYNFYQLINPIKEVKGKRKTEFGLLKGFRSLRYGKTFIISDLFSKNLSLALDYLCSKGQDIVVLHILAPEEINPNYNGEIKLIDIETNENRMIQVDKIINDIYIKKIKKFVEKNKEICQCRDVKYVYSTTDMDYISILHKITEVT
ncbi:DUF58 domain-containing protein [Paramaledivibacter caminithermalis]|jgi:uncharacterized protein (DUF58 family)|uniref:DUF58 domain-containing protein n=1 Tax=Paramaledivibacter caminithermalis (strain DSM 15212 / CIP 107654 / DViRD3) TaxID=1121301 RepID=A0A1M6MVV8_PARC5|nr:DUF58 domain-containing protein [Paramaledivibacter caminithermalis]SHJ87635.1 Protein of unknown function DUF58 [Paramaledivibacter caminithermalis DSM 15212]